ncbi:hypothetical protein BH10ACI1_BH10ACI1_16700 [soil metagenome]
MKKIINQIFFENNNRMSAVFALLIVSLIILGCGGKPEMPADSVTQSLVKTSINDLADAVDKEDFKAFREKASADFQSSFTEAQLKTTFQSYIDQKATIVPLLRKAAGKELKFSSAPSIREEKGSYILVANGNIDLPDEDVKELKFENEWVWRNGAWKLLKIKI